MAIMERMRPKSEFTNPPLVENIAKKNRNRFSIAVLLTTLICSRLNDYIYFYVLPTNILRIWGILICRWKGVLHAQKKFKLQLQNIKEKFGVV
jgi:hypothetical protein